MASTVLDRPLFGTGSPARPWRRPPAAVLGAAAVSALEAVALVAGALTGLDGLLAAPLHPPGLLVGALVLLLATWVVLCAGGAALLLDGSGARLLTGVACGELVLGGGLLAVGLLTSLLDPLPVALPLPALALTALAVPVGKLLLAGAPSAATWAGQQRRTAVHHPAPEPVRTRARAVTVGLIGLVLVGVALATPAPVHGGDVPAPAGVTGAP
ncbi:hypothetical protein ACI8AC_03220 [Geodermatophilus sp. SYSU D00758]